MAPEGGTTKDMVLGSQLVLVWMSPHDILDEPRYLPAISSPGLSEVPVFSSVFFALFDRNLNRDF